MALAWTRDEDDEEDLLLLFELGSRDRRSRTIWGMSTRWVVMVRSLRCFLSFVRGGEGARGRSRTLSFLERVGLRGGVDFLESFDGVGLGGVVFLEGIGLTLGVGNDTGASFCWREAGRPT